MALYRSISAIGSGLTRAHGANVLTIAARITRSWALCADKQHHHPCAFIASRLAAVPQPPAPLPLLPFSATPHKYLTHNICYNGARHLGALRSIDNIRLSKYRRLLSSSGWHHMASYGKATRHGGVASREICGMKNNGMAHLSKQRSALAAAKHGALSSRRRHQLAASNGRCVA